MSVKSLLFIIMLFIFAQNLLFSEIKLVKSSGYVQLKYNEKADWITPKVGDALKTGYIIYTGFKSSAMIQTNNSTIDVKPLTQLSIASLIETTDKEDTDLYLKYGNIKANVNLNKEKQTLFKVRSANSTASVRGTSFFFSNEILFVEEGTVNLLTSNGFSLLVQKNETAMVDKLSMPVSPFQNIVKDSSVNILPVGFSGTEQGSDLDSQTSENGLPSKLIIVINVIQ